MASATPPCSANKFWANSMRAGHRGRTYYHFATRGDDSGIPGTRRAPWPPSLQSHFSRFPVKPATEVLGDRPMLPLDQPAQENAQVYDASPRGAARACHMPISVLKPAWVRWVACCAVHARACVHVCMCACVCGLFSPRTSQSARGRPRGPAPPRVWIGAGR